MTRLFYSAGVARIVVIQQNWSARRKSTDETLAADIGIAGRVERG